MRADQRFRGAGLSHRVVRGNGPMRDRQPFGGTAGSADPALRGNGWIRHTSSVGCTGLRGDVRTGHPRWCCVRGDARREAFRGDCLDADMRARHHWCRALAPLCLNLCPNLCAGGVRSGTSCPRLGSPTPFNESTSKAVPSGVFRDGFPVGNGVELVKPLWRKIDSSFSVSNGPMVINVGHGMTTKHAVHDT